MSDKKLYKRMREAAGIGKLVRIGSNTDKSWETRWKSLLSPRTAKRRTRKETIDLIEQVLSGEFNTPVPLEPVERKVRFELFKNEMIEAEPEVLSEQNIKDCWWNRLEQHQTIESIY